MKICFIKFGFYCHNNVLTPLYEYSHILKEKGFNVTVLVRSNKNNLSDKNNLKIRAVCKEYFSTKVTHIIFLLRLISILRNEEFDVVHIFNSPGVSILPIFCRGYKNKLILDIQTGGDQEKIKNYFLDKLTFIEARFFDKVIILSNGLKDKLFGNEYFDNFYIIPLGANLKRFKRSIEKENRWMLKYKKDNHILIYIGDLNKNRKLENMLKAFQIVLKKYGKNLKLVIIGGSKKDINRLRIIASNLNISDYVTFLGRISYKYIPNYLVSSDIGLSYIPKSKIYDVQPPLKTLEYLAALLPVVATNSAGNLEIIKDGYNGLIATDNYQDYADKILTFLNNQQLRYQVKANTFDSIRKYDWNDIVNNVIRVYKEKR